MSLLLDPSLASQLAPSTAPVSTIPANAGTMATIRHRPFAGVAICFGIN